MDFIVPAHTPAFTNKIGLIDADFIKYRVISKVLKELDIKNVYDREPKNLATFTQAEIDRMLDWFNPKSMIFCFSGITENTYRYDVAFEKKYKGNRKSQLLYQGQEDDKINVIKYIKERYPTLLFKDLEADDLISMLQDDDTFIVSEDKDAQQCPGTHWNINRGEFQEITKQDAWVFLMRQMLLGDTVDNIGGLKSYGEVTVYELLTNTKVKDYHTAVMKAYTDIYGLTEGIDRFTETWNLVKLRLNRGAYFKKKYALAFDTLEMIKLQK